MNRKSYSLVRVYTEDFILLKEWAYESNTTVIDVISVLTKSFNEKILLGNMHPSYFLSDEHKTLYIKHLEIESPILFTQNILIGFYMNSAIGKFNEDIKNPLNWLGDWNKGKAVFMGNEKYLALEEDKKQLVDFANELLINPDPIKMLEALAHIEISNLAAAQEMLRLKLLKI